MKLHCFLLFLCSLLQGIAYTQTEEDLLLIQLETENRKNQKPEKVLASYKTTRVVNAHSLETTKKQVLDFRVTHRFGSIGSKYGGGFHGLYGLDNSSNIRIAFEYGVTDRIAVGFGRSKINELFDLYGKYRLLWQTEDNRMPISLVLHSSFGYTSRKDDEYGTYKVIPRRLNYVSQIILGRKFSERFTVQLMGVYSHRNFVEEQEDENNNIAVGAAARLKLTKRFAILGDYYWVFSNFRQKNRDRFFMPLGVGFEIETGGHVFHLTFTNASGIVENQYLTATTEPWKDLGIKFGFNISRNFTIIHPHKAAEMEKDNQK
ncbi:MAG: DUF5777 family beta-barrel protein [Bacteroidia bacterium]|nr:DUF5777 family beta-barrel protein [Bacteroidia bacterium]